MGCTVCERCHPTRQWMRNPYHSIGNDNNQQWLPNVRGGLVNFSQIFPKDSVAERCDQRSDTLEPHPVDQILRLRFGADIIPLDVRVQEPDRESVLIEQTASERGALEQRLELSLEFRELDRPAVIHQKDDIVQRELDKVERDFERDVPAIADGGDGIRASDSRRELS